MEKEIWKDIPGYEGYYQVSSLGRVKSLERVVGHTRHGEYTLKGKIRKLSLNTQGYLIVRLSNGGIVKTIKVHKLVAMAFLNHEPCGYKEVVDHIDNNTQNNRLDNLQLITNRENTSKDRSGYSSSYIGVSWYKPYKKWRASIHVDNKKKHLGYFTDEYDAHLAYQNELKKYLDNKKDNDKKN